MLHKCLTALAIVLLLQNAGFGAVDQTYLSELIAKDKQLHLAERPEWRKLLHYVPNLIAPGVHGLVDSPGFYNAPDGKISPQAELDATLASFFSDIEENNTRQNPQCLFIARYAWLNEQLSFDPDRMPRHECKRYNQWLATLNPAGLTVVFASAYLNSPSSMYGHPLLRVDAKDQDEQTRLLAYAITFSADTDETNGLAFAINGLFGGYAGTFSILPYYIKVREYSDLENRDIWEYQLNLSPAEVDRILREAWELGPIYFQYYFFDENCAYHLLGLLQVARPDLELTSQFRWWAIPADAVRALANQNGMIKKVVYRPASATITRYRLAALSETEKSLVMGLSTGKISTNDPALLTLPKDREATVLEATQEYVGYRRETGKHDVADPARLSLELNNARGDLPVPAQTPDIPMPAIHPDQGHGSSRATLGAGREDGTNFQEITARATYHDILDTDGGYARGAQIEFFSLAMRHYDSGVSRLERFTPVNILSLTPRDDFFKSMSWKIAAGWQRVYANKGGKPLAFAVDGGAGRSWSTDTALWYALVDGSTRVSKRLDSGFDLGTGASAGILVDPSPAWRLHGYASKIRYFLGQRDTATTIGLDQRIALKRDLALRLDFAHKDELHKPYNTATLSMLYYF